MSCNLNPLTGFCPECRCKTIYRVIESRSVDKGVRRRKQCSVCATRYTMYEITEEEYRELKVCRRAVSKILITLKEVKEDRKSELTCFNCDHYWASRCDLDHDTKQGKQAAFCSDYYVAD